MKLRNLFDDLVEALEVASPQAAAIFLGWGLQADWVSIEKTNPLLLVQIGLPDATEVWVGWGEAGLGIARTPRKAIEGGLGDDVAELEFGLRPLFSEWGEELLFQIGSWMTHFDAWQGGIGYPDPWGLFVELVDLASDWAPLRLLPPDISLTKDLEEKLEEAFPGGWCLFKVGNPLRLLGGSKAYFGVGYDRFGRMRHFGGGTPQKALGGLLEGGEVR